MNEDGTPSNRLDSLALSIVQDLGSSASTVKEAIEDPLITTYVQDGITKGNEQAISRATRVQVCGICIPYIPHVCMYARRSYNRAQHVLYTLYLAVIVFVLVKFFIVTYTRSA